MDNSMELLDAIKSIIPYIKGLILLCIAAVCAWTIYLYIVSIMEKDKHGHTKH